MRYLHKSHATVWLVMTLLLVCGAAAFPPPHVSGVALRQEQSLVTHVLRYNTSEAGEVSLVWGVSGWQVLPELQRPAGTTIVKAANEVMQTPMNRTNGSFEVTLQLAPGSTIDYIFHITRARSGVKAEAWDQNRLPERYFRTVIVANGVTDVTPTISLGQELLNSTTDVSSQWIAALIILGMTLLIGLVTLRFNTSNTYLDF